MKYWMELRVHELLELFEKTFGSVTLSEHPRSLLADGVTRERYNEIEFLEGVVNWKELEYEILMNNQSSLSLVNERGYRFLLPAFVCKGLGVLLDRRYGDLVDVAIDSLSPKFYEELYTWFLKEDYRRSLDMNRLRDSWDEGFLIRKYEMLTNSEIACIIELLEFASNDGIGLDSSRAKFALNTYWEKMKNDSK